MAVSCRQGNAGDSLTVEILDRTNGTVRATVPIGGDQIAYDAPTNRYYLAASRWTGSGLFSGPACTAASPCTPVLAIIDAASRMLVQPAFSGNNAHSVGVDPVTHQVYLPFSSSTAPAGCETCDNVPTDGVLVFQE
jgi:DNA-binding beta-propeller fold protein YncE